MVCVSSHGAVGMIVVILTSGTYGDTELTKVASGMRRDIYSVMADHKEVSTRV